MSADSTGNGKLILFCGPSGSGKTSIVHELLRQFPELSFSISATTRKKRNTESDGNDYYFLAVNTFKDKISNEEFVEWEEVYPGLYYGTLKSEVERIWKSGKIVVFDVDVEGGLNIKKQYGNNLLALFVRPPSVDDLRKRLTARATETDQSLATRIAKAEMELNYANRFDHVLVNEQLENTVREAAGLVKDFIQKEENT